MDNPTSKTCTKCREVKPLERFSPGQGLHGCRSQCRDCRRKPRKTPQRIKTDTHKECSSCLEVLPLGDFTATQGRPVSVCRRCKGSMKKAWIARNPGKASPPSTPQSRARRAAYARRYNAANPEIGRQVQARRRARKAGVGFTAFGEEQVARRVAFFGDRCWMCASPEWSHLDHVKPLAKGGAHCLANLRPACAPCNQRKGAKWYGVAQLSRFLVA